MALSWCSRQDLRRCQQPVGRHRHSLAVVRAATSSACAAASPFFRQLLEQKAESLRSPRRPHDPGSGSRCSRRNFVLSTRADARRRSSPKIPSMKITDPPAPWRPAWPQRHRRQLPGRERRGDDRGRHAQVMVRRNWPTADRVFRAPRTASAARMEVCQTPSFGPLVFLPVPATGGRNLSMTSAKSVRFFERSVR